MKRVVVTVVMISMAMLLLAACGDSNPLIGKWKSATKNMACNEIGTIEFTEKMVHWHMSSPVTYSRDGARYLATMAVGYSFVFEKDGDALRMIKPFGCQLVKV